MVPEARARETLFLVRSGFVAASIGNPRVGGKRTGCSSSQISPCCAGYMIVQPIGSMQDEKAVLPALRTLGRLDGA